MKLTLASLPPHGFRSGFQIVSIYGLRAINVECFENLSINVVAMELVNHVVIAI